VDAASHHSRYKLADAPLPDLIFLPSRQKSRVRAVWWIRTPRGPEILTYSTQKESPARKLDPELRNRKSLTNARYQQTNPVAPSSHFSAQIHSRFITNSPNAVSLCLGTL
jgi:hypothetical protein